MISALELVDTSRSFVQECRAQGWTKEIDVDLLTLIFENEIDIKTLINLMVEMVRRVVVNEGVEFHIVDTYIKELMFATMAFCIFDKDDLTEVKNSCDALMCYHIEL